MSLVAVWVHNMKAQKAGKCLQCRRPWYDGSCSCGQWGAEEERIAKLVAPILAERDRQLRERYAKQQAEDIRKIDASLKTVKELQRVWEEP